MDYVNVICPNCGRLRVEKKENMELVCEKCNWNLTLKCYEEKEEEYNGFSL